MHIMTLLFCAILVSGTTALVMVITKATRRTYPGFNYWMLAALARFVSALLYNLPRDLYPLWLTVILTNTIHFSSYIANAHGLALFTGQKKGGYRWEVLIILAFVTGCAYFTYIHPDTNLRTALMSIFRTLVYGWNAAILLRQRTAYAGAGDILLVLSFGIWAITDFVTIFFMLTTPVHATLSLSSQTFLAYYLPIAITLSVTICLGEIMMNSQRLEYDLRVAQEGLQQDIRRRAESERQFESYRAQLEELVSVRTAELSLSESKFRALVEQSLVGIYIQQHSYLRYANAALCQMLGYAEEELIDRIPVTEIVGQQHREKIKDLIRSLTPGSNQKFQYTACLIRRGGNSVDVEIYSRAIDYAGHPASIGVIIDVSERNRAMADLRNLALRLQTVREEERTRIARDIHDDLGQMMTALKLQIGWLKNQVPPESPAIFIEKLAEMKQLTDSAIQSVHDISWALRPGVLDTVGLTAAIEWLGKDFQRRAGIRCYMDLSAETIAFNPDAATHIFRICQELLNNVTRHAKASRVKLMFAQDGLGYCRLEVQDDGIGIANTTPGSHSLGLLGIRERVQQIGGELDIAGPPKLRGTCVRVTVPVNQRQSADKPGYRNVNQETLA